MTNLFKTLFLTELRKGMWVTWKRMFGTYVPNYHVRPDTILLGVGIALAIGFLGGLIPALRLRRLEAVQVLREEA